MQVPPENFGVEPMWIDDERPYLFAFEAPGHVEERDFRERCEAWLRAHPAWNSMGVLYAARRREVEVLWHRDVYLEDKAVTVVLECEPGDEAARLVTTVNVDGPWDDVEPKAEDRDA